MLHVVQFYENFIVHDTQLAPSRLRVFEGQLSKHLPSYKNDPLSQNSQLVFTLLQLEQFKPHG